MMEISEMPMEEARRITGRRMVKEYGSNLLQRRKVRTAADFFHPARRTSSSYRGELLPPSAANFFHSVTPPATV